VRLVERTGIILGAAFILAGLQFALQKVAHVSLENEAAARAAAPSNDHAPRQSAIGLLQPEDHLLYLPLVANNRVTRRVNLPYFAETRLQDIDLAAPIVFTETAVFWFGAITPAENYADVRVGYNDNDLYVRLAIYDRLLWYDPTPAPADLIAWDSVSLFLNLAVNGGSLPTDRAYRFDAALSDWQIPRTAWQAAYQGNGSGWSPVSLVFTTSSGYRWESDTVGGLNNHQNNRGWTLTYRVPFTSLGLNGPPSLGSQWGAALAVHDRESASGPPLVDQTWPENLLPNNPESWGVFAFGLPEPVAVNQPGEFTTIREEGATRVSDAAVGGTIPNLCPGDPVYIWNGWAEDNFGSEPNFNLQNQADLADWPCFAKYFVTFPLNSLPQGVSINSATLTLHHWGGSDLNAAQPSLIQVMTVAEDWDEASITWNNAPLALENIARTWEGVYTVVTGDDWPGQAVNWEVTRAVQQAVARGLPLRLALYSADAARHSGKYFTTSETGDWNLAGRPTLTVQWSNP